MPDQSKQRQVLRPSFKIHDEIFENDRACIRYTAIQGNFNLDVSEWYYFNNDLIETIVAYNHIGEIRGERKLANPPSNE